MSKVEVFLGKDGNLSSFVPGSTDFSIGVTPNSAIKCRINGEWCISHRPKQEKDTSTGKDSPQIHVAMSGKKGIASFFHVDGDGNRLPLKGGDDIEVLNEEDEILFKGKVKGNMDDKQYQDLTAMIKSMSAVQDKIAEAQGKTVAALSELKDVGKDWKGLTGKVEALVTVIGKLPESFGDIKQCVTNVLTAVNEKATALESAIAKIPANTSAGTTTSGEKKEKSKKEQVAQLTKEIGELKAKANKYKDGDDDEKALAKKYQSQIAVKESELEVLNAKNL